MDLIEIAKKCQRAAFEYAELSTDKKNLALEAIASLLEENSELIYKANLSPGHYFCCLSFKR